ncbi:hypothetical protein O4H61_16590 [Roseovarius aestuarii]|jgi:hypothetical protein|nr:hypothetical protein [Roseovarius aestuarii]
MNKLVKTEFGYVEDDALAALQDEFDTMAVLECVEKVEILRGELGRLHSELMGLHSMATRIIRGNTHIPMNGSGEDIHQQAEIVDSAAFDLIELGEDIQRRIEPLKELFSDAVLEQMEEDGM